MKYEVDAPKDDSKSKDTWVLFGILKFFHPPIVHVGGMFSEVKNFKNPNPKGVFHPKFFFKSHQFLVISLTEVSRGPIVCREECIYKCISICTTNWWLLKILFGRKTTFGVWFFGFFTSKNMPSLCSLHACKKISKKIISWCGALSLPILKCGF